MQQLTLNPQLKTNYLLDKLKKFKTQTILVLECKKISDHKSILKIFHSSARSIFND